MDGQTTQRLRLLNGLSPDRRGSVRFPVNLDLRYSVGGLCRPAENGSGRTVDMSSSGLSFIADRPLPVGKMLDLSIDWPVLLGNGVQLQVVTSGVVVRSIGAFAALRIGRSEFKTKARG